MSDEHDMREAIKSLRAAGNIDAAQNLQDRLDSGSGPESEPGSGGPGQDTGRCTQLAAAGAHADAIECLDRLIRAGGDDPTPYELMAVSQEAVGNLKKAATYLDRALELAGGKDGARYRILVGLAALWIRHGRPGKAVTIIEKKGSGTPRPDSRLSELHGRALLMQDKHAKAIAVFEAAAAAAGTGKEDGGGEEKGRNPDASLLAGLCRALYETGRHADAAQRGAEAGAGSAKANLYAALALERAGRPDGAAAHYRMAASARVSDAHTEDDSWYRAAALYRTGRPKEAARSLGLAVDDKAAPSSTAAGASPAHTPTAPGPAFCCLAGRILEGMGRPAEAQHMYRRAFRTGGKNGCSGSLYHAALACRLLAESTGDGSWNNKARDLARRALSCNGLHPDARDLSEEVAELLRPKKGPQTPRPGYRRDGRSQRDVPPKHPDRGGRGPDAAKHGTATKPDPGGGSRGKITKHPVPEYTEAAAGAFAEATGLIRDGRYSEALDCLEKNRRVFMRGARDPPSRIKEQYFRGIIYCGLGKYEKAADCLGEVADLAREPPHKPSGLGCLGYTISENPRRADACFLAGLAYYRRGLSGQFEDYPSDKIYAYPVAHRMLEEAATLDPGLKGVKTLLGMTRMQMARFPKFNTTKDAAVDTLCGAIREDPWDAAALYNLAQIWEWWEDRTVSIGPERLTPGELYKRACESAIRTLEGTYARGYALDLSYRHAEAVECYREAVECYREAIRMDPEYDEDFCDGIDNAHPHRPAPPPTPGSGPESETHVIDTNIGIRCTVMLVLELCAKWRDLTPDGWKPYRCLLDAFEEHVSAGRYVIPNAVRWEIRKHMEKIVSCELGAEQELAEMIVKMAKKHLANMCPSSDTQAIPEFDHGDIMRVKRMYWRAWIGMTPGKKEEYMDQKKPGQLRGGPPLGSADVKILATAAHMAAEGGTRVVLLTHDQDFLAFRDEIATLSVDVREVGGEDGGEGG